MRAWTPRHKHIHSADVPTRTNHNRLRHKPRDKQSRGNAGVELCSIWVASKATRGTNIVMIRGQRSAGDDQVNDVNCAWHAATRPRICTCVVGGRCAVSERYCRARNQFVVSCPGTPLSWLPRVRLRPVVSHGLLRLVQVSQGAIREHRISRVLCVLQHFCHGTNARWRATVVCRVRQALCAGLLTCCGACLVNWPSRFRRGGTKPAK